MQRENDPTRCVPSAAAIKQRLLATERAAAKLRVLLKASEQLQKIEQSAVEDPQRREEPAHA